MNSRWRWVAWASPSPTSDELEDFLESQRAHGGGELEAP